MVIESVKMNYLSKEEVKELCFIMHNGKTEEARKAANGKLVMNYKNGILGKSIAYLKNIYGKKFYNQELVKELVSAGLDILSERAWFYDPENERKANLLSYSSPWIESEFKKVTNPGLTENQIRNLGKVYHSLKNYERDHEAKWVETENSVLELSKSSGLSVKVVKNTLNIYYHKNAVSYSEIADRAALKEEGPVYDRNDFWENYEQRRARNFINSLNAEETAVLETMVDTEHGYTLISEREGVRLIAAKGFPIGRGTLKTKREALKAKFLAFNNNLDYEDDFGSLAA